MRGSREDEQIYRRGLVMGLTMAEVMVLVIFALLLLIGFQVRKSAENAQARAQLVQVAKAIGLEPSEIPDNFERLVEMAELAREVERQAANPSAANGLKEAKELLAIGREVRDGLGNNNVGQTSTQAARDFVNAATTAFRQQGARFGTSGMWMSDAATAQQKEQGNGRVLPPCAVAVDGRPAYIFTARLFNHELQLEDRDLAPVQPLDVWPLFERITRQQRVQPIKFLAETKAVFDWSKRMNCRFFVWIEDATGAAEKRLYKERLRAVGQHFYYFEPSESVEGRSAAQ